MKEVSIGDKGKILLVKEKGEIRAIGSKCSHSSAPLKNGGKKKKKKLGYLFNLKLKLSAMGELDVHGMELVSAPKLEILKTILGILKIKIF